MSWFIGGEQLTSRLFLGTAKYPSLAILREAISRSATQVITLSIRREQSGEASAYRLGDLLQTLPVKVLPNTAGCRSAREAILTAHLARELFHTNWLKLEIIGEDKNLVPDPFALVEATRALSEEGFEIFPFTTTDPVVAERLLHAGAKILMPWGAPIGTGKGLHFLESLKALRAYFPTTPLIVDAGIGSPSDAARAMEIGFDGVLLNTAIAEALDPAPMAEAFRLAVVAGRQAFEAGLMIRREFAAASSPSLGIPFWKGEG